jgi:hypothetical protein
VEVLLEILALAFFTPDFFTLAIFFALFLVLADLPTGTNLPNVPSALRSIVYLTPRLTINDFADFAII